MINVECPTHWAGISVKSPRQLHAGWVDQARELDNLNTADISYKDRLEWWVVLAAVHMQGGTSHHKSHTQSKSPFHLSLPNILPHRLHKDTPLYHTGIQGLQKPIETAMTQIRSTNTDKKIYSGIWLSSFTLTCFMLVM